MTRIIGFILVCGLMAATAALAGSNNYNDRGLLPMALFSASPLTGPAVTSAVVDTRLLNNVGLQVNISVASASAVGNYIVDTSEDYSPSNAGNWTPLPFTSATTAWSNAAVGGTPAAVTANGTGAAQTFKRDIIGTAASFMRVRYVPSATGAGVFSVYMSGK